jgi:hypothetical protein
VRAAAGMGDAAHQKVAGFRTVCDAARSRLDSAAASGGFAEMQGARKEAGRLLHLERHVEACVAAFAGRQQAALAALHAAASGEGLVAGGCTHTLCSQL